MGSQPVWIGILGCSNVNEYAILAPMQDGADIVVTAIAARDAGRAAEYARAHDIPQSYGGYDRLIAEADVDAIYIALPNALHHRWTMAALRAGRAVLCEKPLASNAEQAAEMAALADQTGLPLLEATHWRDHPVAARMMEIVRSGQLGALKTVEARFGMPGGWLARDNFRFSFPLAGGWTMDQGCYCISLLRLVTGAEPEAVLSARPVLAAPEVDVAMRAELLFPGGVRGHIGGAMTDDVPAIECHARIEGSLGALTIVNPFLPGENAFTTESGSRLILETAAGRHEEKMPLRSSWRYQADKFSAMVRQGAGGPSPAWDGVANMRAIDAVYRAAGLSPRA